MDLCLFPSINSFSYTSYLTTVTVVSPPFPCSKASIATILAFFRRNQWFSYYQRKRSFFHVGHLQKRAFSCVFDWQPNVELVKKNNNNNEKTCFVSVRALTLVYCETVCLGNISVITSVILVAFTESLSCHFKNVWEMIWPIQFSIMTGVT